MSFLLSLLRRSHIHLSFDRSLPYKINKTTTTNNNNIVVSLQTPRDREDSGRGDRHGAKASPSPVEKQPSPAVTPTPRPSQAGGLSTSTLVVTNSNRHLRPSVGVTGHGAATPEQQLNDLRDFKVRRQTLV